MLLATLTVSFCCLIVIIGMIIYLKGKKIFTISMFQTLLFSLIASVAVVNGLVPQVPLCAQEGCPMVSRVGVGTLHLGDKIGGLSDPQKINDWLRNANEQGINLIDTADVYPVKGGTNGDSAMLLGKALALTPGLREKFQIVAKTDIIFPNAIDTSKAYLNQQLEWFLTNLQSDYVDILLLHFPNSFMNAVEVAETFHEMKVSGKVKHFGTSNHYPAHRDALQTKCNDWNITLVTNEIEVSVWNPSYLNYDSGLVDDSVTKGYRVLGWGPLGGDPIGGLNRLFDRHGKRQLKIHHALKQAGKDLGEDDETVVALSWILSHPSGIVPLLGTTQTSRLNNLLRAFDLVEKFEGLVTTWWSVGSAGGLCPLADSQCNYKEYMAFDTSDVKDSE